MITENEICVITIMHLWPILYILAILKLLIYSEYELTLSDKGFDDNVLWPKAHLLFLLIFMILLNFILYCFFGLRIKQSYSAVT